MDINVDLLYLFAGLSVIWSTYSYKHAALYSRQYKAHVYYIKSLNSKSEIITCDTDVRRSVSFAVRSPGFTWLSCVKDRFENYSVCGAFVQWYLQEKAEILGAKHVTLLIWN